MKAPRTNDLILLFLALSLLFAAVGFFSGDFAFLEKSTTYGNMDAASDQSFVQSLLPGVRDHAAEKNYTFGHGVHWATVRAMLLVFIVMLSLRTIGARDVRAGSKRFLLQWVSFVIARLGLFRVSGLYPVRRCQFGVFPFFNCQACEMATGGCPIGMIQVSLSHRRIPWLPVGIVLAFAISFGRYICGWFCPFGFLLDIVDRVSLGRMRNLPRATGRLKIYVLAGIFVVPLALGIFGVVSFQIFCATICPNGIVYGLIPYWATTAKQGFAAAISGSAEIPAGTYIIWAHIAVLLAYLVASILLSGRFFCRFLCPLGAFLGLFNKISILQIEHDWTRCNDCGICAKKCTMGCDPTDRSFMSQFHCIRCGECIDKCPRDARHWKFFNSPMEQPAPDRTNKSKVVSIERRTKEENL